MLSSSEWTKPAAASAFRFTSKKHVYTSIERHSNNTDWKLSRVLVLIGRAQPQRVQIVFESFLDQKLYQTRSSSCYPICCFYRHSSLSESLTVPCPNSTMSHSVFFNVLFHVSRSRKVWILKLPHTITRLAPKPLIGSMPVFPRALVRIRFIE